MAMTTPITLRTAIKPAGITLPVFMKAGMNLPARAIDFPLRHPANVSLNREADNYSFKQICPWIIENQNYYWQLRHKFTAALPDPVRQKVRELRSKLRG